jgi:hypothetical protein
MAEEHPFTIEIETHLEEHARRYRWGIYESGKLRDHAKESFLTKPEAHADAERAMEALVAAWRIGKKANDN